MEIILAEAAGFCFGVQRAIRTAHETADKTNPPIYTLGPLIHNPQVVAELYEKGIEVCEQPEDIDAGVVIVRCHGVPPKVLAGLHERGMEVVDATCPFVRRAMRWASQLKDEGYQVVIVGDESHPEVKAIYGASGETAWIVETPQAIDELPAAKRIGIIAQTTQSTANYQQCVGEFIGRSEEVKAFDTICTATEQRQFSARELAAQVDVMVVIGGHNSANTKRLAEVCQESGARTYHIETAEELKPSWLSGADKVGVTAGASTPNWLIQGVIQRMTEFTDDKVRPEENEAVENTEGVVEKADEPVGEEKPVEPSETPVDEASDAVDTDEVQEVPGEPEESGEQEEPEDQEEQMEDYGEMLPTLTPGTIIEGKVVQISSDEVLVDIGYKSEGRVPLNELGLKPDQSPEDILSVGEDVNVWVLKVDEAEGSVLLSKRRADAKDAWEKLEAIYEQGETMEATVTQTVKGGLLVDVGVRGFIPASHISRNFVDNLDKYIGQTLKLKIIELDRQKNNVVFSHKEVLEAEYQEAKERILSTLEENTIVDGVVRRLTDFGAFVDIGSGVEGLLHVSEMAHSRVNRPSDVLSEGDEIKVMVLGVDREKERISLGLKQTLPDPWDTITERYQSGDIVNGTVTRVVDFGAFVKLEDGVEGLIHISQLAHRHVAKVEEVVSPGDEIEVKIISLDPTARRIGLSLKELEEKPVEDKPAPSEKPRSQDKKADDGTSDEELTTTIGDMFGDLFKK